MVRTDKQVVENIAELLKTTELKAVLVAVDPDAEVMVLTNAVDVLQAMGLLDVGKDSILQHKKVLNK